MRGLDRTVIAWRVCCIGLLAVTAATRCACQFCPACCGHLLAVSRPALLHVYIERQQHCTAGVAVCTRQPLAERCWGKCCSSSESAEVHWCVMAQIPSGTLLCARC